MTIARFGVGAPVALGSAVVPFNPVQQDVILQFDAFGNKLSLWAWPVGGPFPLEPQVVAFDNTYAEGPVGLISSSVAALPSDSTTYRFVQVAQHAYSYSRTVNFRAHDSGSLRPTLYTPRRGALGSGGLRPPG